MPVSPDDVEAKRIRAVRLAPLKDSDAWQELRNVVAERKEFHLKRLLPDLLGDPRNTPPVDQRKLDWLSGYVAGAEDLLERPELAEQFFASAFAKLARAELARKENE
jgi:hypothetical protein